MKAIFRTLCAVLLCGALLVGTLGCAKDQVDPEPPTPSSSDTDPSTSDPTDTDPSTSDPTDSDPLLPDDSEPDSSDPGDWDDPGSWDDSIGETGNLNGILKNIRQRDDAQDAKTTINALDPMNSKGGAQKEADALRTKILSSSDTLKITGTTYYFSPGGDDDNDGTSPTRPLRSLDMLERMELKAGDGVLLERGSVFRISSTVRLVSGVSYGAYGKGDKPQIWGSEKNYAGHALWKPYTVKNFWVADYTRLDAGIMVFDHGKSVGRKQYYLQQLRANGDFYHDASGLLYLYSETDPNKYESIEIGSKMTMMAIPDGAKDITIENLYLKYTGAHGIQSSGSNKNIHIRNCVLGWIGGSIQGQDNDVAQRFGNAIEFWNSAEDSSVENCWVYQTFDAALTIQGHRTFKNISFKDNLLEYNNFNIEWWISSSGPQDRGIENFSVTGNIMRFSGYGWGSNYRKDLGRDAHINAGAGDKTIPVFKNYIVTGNIFDCAYTYMIGDFWDSTLWMTVQKEYHVSENTFYQRDRTGNNWLYGKVGNGAIGFGVRAENVNPSTASSQTELEAAVSKFDSSPKLVKWLDN